MAGKKTIRDTNGNDRKASPTSLEVRFAQAQSHLNNSRRQLLRAILDNHEETFFLSSREMAKRYNVDAATIVRSIQVLGYEKFADFAADLRKHFVTRITPYAVLRATTREKRSVDDHIRHSVDRDSENLSVLRSTLDTDRVIELAKLMQRSRRILVVGVDLAASLAGFLAYGLTPLGFDSEAPIGSAGNLHHKVDLLTDKDLLIAISFGRCLRETVESVLRAKERGVPTFGITDSDTTPIALHCDTYLITPAVGHSFSGSYVAPMSLMNAITVACAHIQPKRSLARLRRIDDEYKSGDRWYQESPRRGRAAPNDNGKSARANSRRRQ